MLFTRLRLFALIALVALIFVPIIFGGDTTLIVPNGIKTASTDYVVPTIETPTTGYKTVTSPTLSVPANTAVKVSTLPAGTKVVEIYVATGGNTINYGPVGVSSGTSYPLIAAASKLERAVSTTTPDIYLIGTSAAATATILAR